MPVTLPPSATGGYNIPRTSSYGGGGATSSYGPMRTPPVGTQWDPARGAYVPVGQAGNATGATSPASAQNTYNPNSPAQFAPMPTQTQGAGGTMYGTQESPALTGLKAQTDVGTNAAKTLAAQQAELEQQLAAQQFGFGTQSAAQAGTILQDQTSLQARLQAEAEARRMNQFPQILQGLNSSIPQGGVGGDESAARAAAFARAKDQTGLIARSGTDAVASEMAARGLAGSGIEGSALGNVASTGVGQLGEVTREQLIQDLLRSGQVADRNYAGNLTMRGQNMASIPSLLGLISAGAY